MQDQRIDATNPSAFLRNGKPEMLKSIGGAALLAFSATIAIASYAVSAPADASTNQAASSSAGAARCSSLMGQELGSAMIDKTEFLASGTPANMLGQKLSSDVCRVSAHVTPAKGSRVNIRVWLPANWNGKMYGFGGGGFNGSMSIDGLILAGTVNRGYAAVSTDAGHDVGDGGAGWALGNPEKIIDFGHRANHVGAVATKAIIARFYGTPAKRSYFHGCSNGGRDALMLAQRYPADYDAIIAGAPANSWTALMSSFARAGHITRLSPTVDVLKPKLKLVHDAAMKKCDAADGVKDGMISNPATCRFDPAVLSCKSGSGSDCLSKPEVTAIRAIYQGTRTRDGKTIMPGFPVGSELEWSEWFTAPNGQSQNMAQEFYRHMVYNDAKWDRSNFVLDRDYPAAKRRMAAITDATNADLRPFVRRGGKLLMYHGWNDPAIPAGNSISYFKAARRVLGHRSDQIRLLMVPGMAHCGGGEGATAVDWLTSLENWVEKNQAPDRLTAVKYSNPKGAMLGLGGKALATRPVCAWPKTPHYKGAGPIEQEGSYVCR